jgi:excisionase family DNA binding protein
VMYELRGKGESIRGIARQLGVSRNTVRKYLRSEGIPQPKPRRRRFSTGCCTTATSSTFAERATD